MMVESGTTSFGLPVDFMVLVGVFVVLDRDREPPVSENHHLGALSPGSHKFWVVGNAFLPGGRAGVCMRGSADKQD